VVDSYSHVMSAGAGRDAAASIDVPAWLEREIARGLQGLVALRLAGGPPEDSITGMLDIWLAALGHRTKTWHEELDAERIRRAFRELYQRCEQWPSPRLFFNHLPPRSALPELPPPAMSQEQREANQARIRDIIRSLL
jgi:hypothetical protein